MASKPTSTKYGPNSIALMICGFAICLISLAITFISPQFADAISRQADRPILLILALMSIAFVLYILAIAFALKVTNRRILIWTIVVVAITSRLCLIASYPFQETDAYRYIWDGNVLATGVSPYKYSPKLVADTALQNDNAELKRLADLRQADAALENIRSRISFPELPTVYPPVSQAVFWASAHTTPLVSSVMDRSIENIPDSPSLFSHLVSMKLWITLFDLATLGIVVMLLSHLKLPLGWAIAYGWSPLVLKEFANTGHLDSIAIFFCMSGLYLLIRLLSSNTQGQLFKTLLFAVGVGGLIALGVGSKLFPIILTPLIGMALLKKTGWPPAVGFLFVAIAGSCLFLKPIVFDDRTQTQHDNQPARATQSSDGLYAFLSRWRMNDFIFMCIQENVESPEIYQDEKMPWFVVVPETQRTAINESAFQNVNAVLGQIQTLMGRDPDGKLFQIDKENSSFFIARFMTLGLFAIIAVVLAWRSTGLPCDSFKYETGLLAAGFLTIVWFWLTAPTLNPWYLCWAMPLICFARNRWWLTLSFFATIYYLRFWFRYHHSDTDIFGSGYYGVRFFDFVVTWLEFGPFLIVLMITWLVGKAKSYRIGGASVG